MKLFDVHSHWGTRRGYVLRTEEQLAQQRRTWNSDPKYATEEEMAAYLRAQGVRTILDFGFTKSLPHRRDARLPRLRDRRAGVTTPTSIFGHWLQIDPRTGREGVRGIRALRGREPRLHRPLRLGAGNGLCCERSDIRPVLRGEHRAAASCAGPRRVPRARGAGQKGGGGVPARPLRTRATSTRWPCAIRTSPSSPAAIRGRGPTT